MSSESPQRLPKNSQVVPGRPPGGSRDTPKAPPGRPRDLKNRPRGVPGTLQRPLRAASLKKGPFLVPFWTIWGPKLEPKNVKKSKKNV